MAAAPYQAASNSDVIIPVQGTLEEHHRKYGSKQHFRPTKHLQPPHGELSDHAGILLS